MERNAEIETEREVLKRIVAMLFSFAALAERVSGRSYPVRCLVLWALRRAEAVVRNWLVADDADGNQPAAPMAVLLRNSRAEAMHLAKSFRALAHMLRRQLHLEERIARRLLRGKTITAEEGAPQRGLFAPGSISRLARAMRVALNLDDIVLAAGLRLDSS